MKNCKIMTFEQWRQFLRYGEYLNNKGKKPRYITVKKIRYMRVPAMDKDCNITKGKEIFVSDPLPLQKGMLKFPKIAC